MRKDNRKLLCIDSSRVGIGVFKVLMGLLLFCVCLLGDFGIEKHYSQNAVQGKSPMNAGDTVDEGEVPISNQYTVTYQKNSPKSMLATGSVVDAQSPYSEGTEVTVLPNGDKDNSDNKGFNCSGYTFKGWNTKADGSGTEYAPGDTFTIQENMVLYAQWEVVIVISKVTISPKTAAVYQGEDYPFHAVVSGKGNFTGEVTWTLMGQQMEGTTISQEGLLHIDENESAQTLSISAVSKDNENYWATATVTVKELTRYSLGYAATGGVGDMSSANASYISGTSVTIADCAFTRAGYIFVCWNTSSNGKGYELHPGDTYKITQDITMYAQWRRNGNYDVPDTTEEVVEPEPVIKTKTDREYAEETIALIDAIGEVTADSYSAIATARNSYNALTDAQKNLIDATQYQKLLLREKIYNETYGKGKTTTEATKITAITTTTSKKDTAAAKSKTLSKGKKFKKGDYQYKVTKASGKTGTVTLVKPLKKSIAKVTIPATVTYKKVTYKVTAISSKAFQNCKHFQKVTIGKNVTSIGSKAFYNASNCEAVMIRSTKIKKIGTGAFSQIAYRAYIKMPDKKYRAYEPLLKKSGLHADLRLKTY